MKIGYARVSTDDQSLDLQLDALRAAGCEKIFQDILSGAKTDRPGLTEALAFAREGDVLTVWRLDRLGRSLPHLIEIVEKIKNQGIAFKSLRESIETDTESGKLIFNIFAALADFERGIIQERTRAGLAAARARGRVGGRKGMAPEKIAQLRLLAADRNISPTSICETLGISRSTFYKYAGGCQSNEPDALQSKQAASRKSGTKRKPS